MKAEVEISDEASRMLQGYLDWLESRNTPGSGLRFFTEVASFLRKLSTAYPYYSPCANKILKSRSLFCSQFRQ